MTADTSERRRHALALLLFAVMVSVLFFLIVQEFVVAVLLAAILAAMAYPLHKRLVTWLGGRKTIAAGLTVAIGLLLVVIPLVVFLGLVAEEAVGVSKSALAWAETHKDQHPPELDRLLDKVSFIDKDKFYAKFGELAHKAAHFVVQGLGTLTKGTAHFFLLVFVMLYAMFHFLLAGPALPHRLIGYLPLSEDEGRRTLDTFTSVSRATLVGAVVIGVIQGGLAGLAFVVAGISGALLWTVVMAVASIIPGVGTALVWVPAVCYLVISERYGAAIGVGLWCAVVVGSVDNFLRPVLVGKGAGLPNLLVLLSTLGGLMYFGPVGVVLGPLVAAMFLTCWDLYVRTLHEGAAPAAELGARVAEDCDTNS